MDYQSIYDRLISRAVAEHGHPEARHKRRTGFANHHITPASFYEGGRRNPEANAPDNLVWLTHRQHLLAHWLLARIYGGKMSLAFAYMAATSGKRGKAYENHLMAGMEWRTNDPDWLKTNGENRRKIYASPSWQAKFRSMIANRSANPNWVNNHRAAVREALARPEVRAKMRESRLRMLEDPEARAALVERCKNITPEHKAKIAAANKRKAADPAWLMMMADLNKAKASQEEWQRRNREGGALRSERYWADPEAQRARRELAKRIAADPKVRQRRAEAARKRAADPTWRANSAAAAKRRAADPEWQRRNRERLQALTSNPEWREKNAENNRRLAQDPEWKAKHMAAMKAKVCKTVIGTRISDGATITLTGSGEMKAQGFDSSAVFGCCRGKRKTHKGYTWRYATDDEITRLK
ncbi:hypothetical protein H0K60_004487 [Salmonella enterica]|nr:hypothetical protein [Salmonella enterica]EFR2649730.1 hypothetical protein [Salmonella enterica]EFS1408079.1 hypothetical protein [Salmonella enterica]EHQ8162527.1 hypothetical protein [Salmonella enterica]EJZ9218180.1 hypothetical protein [Salmonella enterica]